MEIKHVKKVVRTGSAWLFVMILLTAGKVNAMGTPASPNSGRTNGTITTGTPPPLVPPSIPPKPILKTAGPQRNVAYFTQWSIYSRNYSVKDIDSSGAANKLSDINYAYAGISPQSKCVSLDPWADYQKPFTTDTVNGQPDNPNDAHALAGNFNQLKELKAKYPKLKLLISIGGWQFSGQFSTAAQPAHLQSFVQSCVDMFINGNIPGLAPGAAAGVFDGIDIDWEYPAYQRTDTDSQGGYTSSPQDTQNYTAMLAEFRKQLGTSHLLTIGAPAGQDKYSKIQLDKITQYLDWINLMAFDYHGNWEPQTDIQAPLYCNPNAGAYCVNASINGYLQAGVPPSMINLGLPFYGHGWTDVPNNNNGLHQSGTKPAPGADPEDPGINDYKVLAQLESQGYIPHRDNITKGFWVFNGSTLWSYDDALEVTIKMNYARSKRLGGAFCWPIDGDDSNGTLLNAMTDSHGT